MKDFMVRAVALLSTLLLVACGGGGGGGAGGSNGITPTTVLADEDGLQITQEVFSANAFAQSFALGFGIGLPASAATSAMASQPVSQPLGTVVGSVIQRRLANSQDIASPALVEACLVDGFVDVVETQNSISFEFLDCDGSVDFPVAGVLNGFVSIQLRNIDENPPTIGADFTAIIDNLSIDDGLNFSVADGDFTGSLQFDIDVTFIDIELSTNSFVIVDNGDESELINYDYSGRLTDTETIDDFSGGLDGYGFDGVIEFFTTDSLVFDFFVGTYTTGEVVLADANGGSISIAANSTDFPAVDIDIDGDDIVDEQPTWSWNDDILALLIFL